MTHPARTSLVSAASAALRGAGLDGIFIIREAAPGSLEIAHNARRESTLHMRTDLYEARVALERAGFEAFEAGSTIFAQRSAGVDPRPPLAKAVWVDDGAGEDGDDGDDGEDGADGGARRAGSGRKSEVA